MASGLAIAALLLCFASALVPALEAGDWRAGLIGFGLSASAVLAAVTALNLRRREEPPPAQSGFRLLEAAAGAIRDALSTVRGFAELLGGEGSKPREGPEMREARRFILEASDDLTQFVASLQDYARHAQGRMRLVEQQVDAAELVEAALSLCRRRIERADIVIIATLPEGVELSCDPARLRGAVASLVGWAATAAPRGSVVTVRLLRLKGDALAVTVASSALLPVAGGADGPFEPDIERHGLDGLALPIARRVALLHSGEVTIETGAKSGTTVRLSLPPGRVTWPDRPENRAA